MRNEILHGDCLELMKKIPDGIIDMVLCDLPYGTTNCKWDSVMDLDLLWSQYKRIVKEEGAIVLFGAEPFSSQLRMSNLKMYKYDWVWDKIKGTGFLNAKKQPMRNHEFVHVFYRKQCLYNPQMTSGHKRKVSFRAKVHQTGVYGDMGNDNMYDSTDRYPRSIQEFSSDTQNSSLHPTQKPVGLIEYLIKTYTNEGDLVLDNCAGSFTTAIGCINTGRDYICMEKEKEYFDIGKERIEAHLAQPKLFAI